MIKIEDTDKLKEVAREVREDVVRMVYNAQSGHPGGSLSAADIMTVLFFNIMNHDSKEPDKYDRDRFILSKGHCSPVYYSVLARTGYMDVEELDTFRKINSRLQGHPAKKELSFIETSTGSLGQGLSTASGIAFALRLNKNFSKIYCLCGDGELDEGQIWESLMTIKQYNLNNLIIIVDNNTLQIDGCNKDVKNIEPLKEKFEAFNYHVLDVDGHNIDELIKIFNEAKQKSDSGKNVIIMAHTSKGKGVSFMENKCEWDGKAPKKEEYDVAIKELEE